MTLDQAFTNLVYDHIQGLVSEPCYCGWCQHSVGAAAVGLVYRFARGHGLDITKELEEIRRLATFMLESDWTP